MEAMKKKAAGFLHRRGSGGKERKEKHSEDKGGAPSSSSSVSSERSNGGEQTHTHGSAKKLPREKGDRDSIGHHPSVPPHEVLSEMLVSSNNDMVLALCVAVPTKEWPVVSDALIEVFMKKEEMSRLLTSAILSELSAVPLQEAFSRPSLPLMLITTCLRRSTIVSQWLCAVLSEPVERIFKEVLQVEGPMDPLGQAIVSSEGTPPPSPLRDEDMAKRVAQTAASIEVKDIRKACKIVLEALESAVISTPLSLRLLCHYLWEEKVQRLGVEEDVVDEPGHVGCIEEFPIDSDEEEEDEHGGGGAELGGALVSDAWTRRAASGSLLMLALVVPAIRSPHRFGLWDGYMESTGERFMGLLSTVLLHMSLGKPLDFPGAPPMMEALGRFAAWNQEAMDSLQQEACMAREKTVESSVWDIAGGAGEVASGQDALMVLLKTLQAHKKAVQTKMKEDETSKLTWNELRVLL